MVTCKATQIHDDDLVGSLAIRLRAERRRHMELDAGQAHELLPEQRREHWTRGQRRWTAGCHAAARL
jgi:hypothetical protein